MTFSVWGSFGTNTPTRDVFATETFVTLRALTPPPSALNVTINVDGGAAKGDGSGGIFYYDPASVLADDNVNVIAPTPIPTAGRWRRLSVPFNITGAINATGPVTAQYFQATGVASSPGTMSFESNFLVLQGGTAGFQVRDSGDANTNLQISDSGVVTVRTSVVTPLVQSSGTTDLNLQIGAAYGWTFSISGNVAFFPASSDNVAILGKSTQRWLTGFISNIDSGTAGSLALRTNNGLTQVLVNNAAVAPDRPININAGQSGVLNTTISVGNGVGFAYSTGDNSHQFYTDASTLMQFEITRTVGANRHAFVTGSNGGNPVLNTSAGGIDISPATVRFPGIGTTAVAANATLNVVGSNDLLRSTSSQRYKKDWVDLEDADLDILDSIRTIKYKSQSEQDDPSLIHYGMLAEDVFKLNKNLVTFNTIDVGFDLDVPDWVQYERFIPLLIEQRRRDVKRIEALEAKLGIH